MKTEIDWVRTVQDKKVVTLKCDLCGTEATKPNSYNNPFGHRKWDNCRVTVEADQGTRYPEGGVGVTQSFDICPTCWATKLVPFIEREGNSSVTEKEWD